MLSRHLHVLMSVRPSGTIFHSRKTADKEHVENCLQDLPDQFSYEEQKIARKVMQKPIPIITIWELKINFIRPR